MIQRWWEEIKVEGWAGHRMATKLKLLKNKIKEWAKENFGDVRTQKICIPAEIQALDRMVENGELSISIKIDQNLPSVWC